MILQFVSMVSGPNISPCFTLKSREIIWSISAGFEENRGSAFSLLGVSDFQTEDDLVTFLHNFGIAVIDFETLENFAVSFAHIGAEFSLRASYGKHFVET